METIRQILAAQLRDARDVAELSVEEVAKRAKLSRQSVYDIEVGRQNVRVDQFEALMRACGVTPEQWKKGMHEVVDEHGISRLEHQLRTMLHIILVSGEQDLMQAIQVNLDTISAKALRRRKARDPAHPLRGREEGLLPARRRKQKQPA